MTAPRPICACCRQPYGQRSITIETIKHPAGEPEPPYRGNGIVTKTTKWNTGASTGRAGGVDFSHNETVVTRRIWNGESYWTPYSPFCTLRCALKYARAAYQARNP